MSGSKRKTNLFPNHAQLEREQGLQRRVLETTGIEPKSDLNCPF